MRPKSWTENKLLEVHFYGKESLIVFQTNPSLRKTKTESLPRRKQLSVFICFLAARRQGQCRALRLVRENLTWWTRGELNPCPKIRWVGFLRGQSVMKFSRAGRKQTRDTATAALFWMTGSRTKHRCTFPADLTHAASRRTLAGYGWRYATALRFGSQSDFCIVCV